MARRKKRLVDLVRDQTFLARKDEHLLAADTKGPLPWLELERVARRYRKTPPPSGDRTPRREISLELERGLRDLGPAHYLGDLQAELLKLGPRDSFEQLERFFPRFFRHFEGASARKRYHLAPNHRAFLREFWRRDRYGRRIYQVGLLMEPKGGGKTPLSAVLGTHTTVAEPDAPNVYVISGARYQANFCHGFAKTNIETGPLAAWLTVGGQSIEYPETMGEFDILSADGDISAGSNPSAAIYDELWLFRHRHQREAWNSQVEALHKRSGRSWVLGISTAGYDKQTILGELYDDAIKHPKLEVLDDGFHLLLKNEETGFLFSCHQAPDDADIEDPKVVRAANPAPWVKPRDLIRGLRREGADELDWRRLHLNQWTKSKSSWLTFGVWDRLKTDTQIPKGAEILLGIDCARTYDTTAVGWAWVSPEGRKVLRAHIWSLRRDVPYHTLVEEDELDNEKLVEPFVSMLDERYHVRAIAFDGRYFGTEARHLASAGHVMIEVEPQSSAMGDAVVQFEKDAATKLLEHDGDRALAGHIDAIDAVRRPDASKKIGKRSEAYPIDGGIAVILANYLSVIELPERLSSYSVGIDWFDDDVEESA